MQKEIQTRLPLTEPMFFVLAALADGDKHGWGILKDVEDLTQGRVSLSPGTLYGIIKRLLEWEWIAESEQRPPQRWDDRRRKYYRLTDQGREAAQAEARRLQGAVDLARGKHLLRAPKGGPA
ncbi:MAG TPA: PadR family transcriptional regulator [Acidobacteriota bacterium]|nr:PadR family transcriptional regulator [Acidobacteriota bacterium]